VHDYDRSSKWLIQHYGGSILRLVGVGDVVSWRPLQAEVVQPRQLPDGLLEVQVAGRPRPGLFVLELATRAEPRLREQLIRGLMLVYLDRHVLPEVVALVLNRGGKSRAASKSDLRSRHGLARCRVQWRVVELWTLPAAALLAADDVGLIPWVPLTNFAGPPEPILQQCRERIDRQASPEGRANLLAVTQILTGLQFKDPRLLAILGGNQAMIESPVLQAFLAQGRREVKQQVILRILAARLGPVPEDLAASVKTINDEQKFDALVDAAAVCPDLEAFRQRLPS
jgi:hypothetical protein